MTTFDFIILAIAGGAILYSVWDILVLLLKIFFEFFSSKIVIENEAGERAVLHKYKHDDIEALVHFEKVLRDMKY